MREQRWFQIAEKDLELRVARWNYLHKEQIQAFGNLKVADYNADKKTYLMTFFKKPPALLHTVISTRSFHAAFSNKRYNTNHDQYLTGL